MGVLRLQFWILRTSILGEQQIKCYREEKGFSLEHIFRKFQEIKQNHFLNTNVCVELAELKDLCVKMQARGTVVLTKCNL